MSIPKKITHAMVFGAGFGTRMKPMTDHIPKPLVPIHGKPMVQYSLDKLQEAGLSCVVINTHHLSEQMDTFVEMTQNDFSFDIQCSHEDVILETGGGIVKALPLLGSDPFFTINGDIIWVDQPDQPPVLEAMMNMWDADTMDVLMLLCPVHQAIGYDGAGDFNISSDGVLYKDTSQSKNSYVYTGIQIINPSLFGGYDPEPFSLRVIYDSLKTDRGDYPRITPLIFKGDWLHIGTVETIERACEYMDKKDL